ncbi:MAG TPA: LysE family translocator [Candidatus Acidoferrales bacterium]|nr:LysE family translocator [Candidatus Acidoferrales bacterium]
MTVSHALITFIAAAGLLTITPGLDTALVLRTAAVSGPRRAMAASIGVCLGLLTWGCIVSFGLGALLAASQFAYNVLRIAGACYLVFLGFKIYFRSGSPLSVATADPDGGAISTWKENSSRWFLRGLFTNLLNPKVGVFYVTFLPLFIPAGVNAARFSLLLASIHATEGILWFIVLVMATRSLSAFLATPKIARALNRATGAIFIGFGAKLLFDKAR